MNSLEIIATCISCDNCRTVCPERAIQTNGKDFFIENWSCTLCGLCLEVCPVDCIKEKQTE
ncbi:MAG: 4Fe-4S binding protein [Bacteriovoracaceae bacterium]|nr:4Fe-4S binding protein [Bacteriovoracaceae bacterium]